MARHKYTIEENGREVTIPSVTTVLKQLGWGSEALIYWANQEGLSGRNIEEARQSPLTVGSVTHALVEADARGMEPLDLGKLPEEIVGQARLAFSAWERWRSRNGFQVLATEQSLCSKTLRFGGTFDLAFVTDKISIMDFKTSNAIYSKDVCQVAAYGRLWDEHHPDRPVSEYHLIRLSKEDGSFHHHSWEAKTMTPAWETFELARRLYDLERVIKGKL